MAQIPIPHPGETVKEDYLVAVGMCVSALAKALGVGAPSPNDIVLGRRGVTSDTSLRLAR